MIDHVLLHRNAADQPIGELVRLLAGGHPRPGAAGEDAGYGRNRAVFTSLPS